MELAVRAMGSLLPKLGDLLKEEYGLQKGVKKKVETLSRELEAAHAVLREISGVPPDQLNELVKLWARDVREASYDMEDIVDAFLVHIDAPEPATETNKLRLLKKKVRSLFKKSKARRDISSQIKEIYKKLEELAARHDKYKTAVDSIVPKPALTIDPRIMNLYKSARELVGIDGPKQELIDMLSLGDDGCGVPDNKKIKVVSVVGFGGLGKTTLAKAVYDQLKLHFECRAFVPVGRNPDIKKVFRDILIALDENTYTYYKLKGLDENQLMGKLNEFIKEKRCFIVIDDIWDKDSWDLIRCALQESNYASRFIITTRISKVGTQADQVYKIKPLSHDNSEKLLFARISDSEGKYLGSPSIVACEKILKKCRGVPLAIITIASLLASRPPEDWSEVYNSIGFGHEDNDDVINTRRILSFSYFDLPSHLKSCLLYLSVFPEDAMIERNMLIWKWIAEGFITEEQAVAAGVGLFELGERYFNELINRNMIQGQDIVYQGYIWACSVHDMVLDLMHQLSSEQNFVTVLNGGEVQKLQGSISRRLALQCAEEHNAGQLANVPVEKVRSIYASDCDFCALCSRLPFLRLVEMVDCLVYEDCNTDRLDQLWSLRHLRYLRSTVISQLPREVRYLRSLLTMDLEYSNIEELPVEVGLLTQLVCLRLSSYKETRVPRGLIGKLTSLQELCIWVSRDEDATMQFVKELGLLRELRVLWTRIVSAAESLQRCLHDSLANLHNIKQIQIQGSPLYEDDGAGLVSSRHLQFLHLECFVFSGLAVWINSSLAPNLCYVDVYVVVVKDQDMETLAKLPELSCLKLRLKSYPESVVSIKIRTDEGVGYFRKLRFLRIYGASIWFDLRGSECNISTAASSNTIMPSLESLEFDFHVRSLKDHNLQPGFDKMLGIQNLGTSSLQRVTVTVYCTGASFVEVDELQAALNQAALIHPKLPNLLCFKLNEDDVMTRYQKACKEMSRAPDLVTKAWNLADIVCSEHIQILRMPDPEASSSKVMSLLYTDNGMELLVLSSNAVHKLWNWEHSDKNPCGELSKTVPSILWQPENGILMTNDTTNGNNPEESTACMALSKNDKYLVSASGGKVLLFDMKTFKVVDTVMESPPAATFLAFYHQEGFSVVFIGMEDSSIKFYNVNTHILYDAPNNNQDGRKGHWKKITGLAFSSAKNVVVSSGADAQLCVWSLHDGEFVTSRYIQHPSNLSGALIGDTVVQFHYDETHLLVVHESQLSIYDWQLECLCSWFPRDRLPAPISSGVYSLGCLLVYAGFCDGAIGIFEAKSLKLHCRIAPSAYIPSSISSGETIYPTVVATHPWKPNQIAVGLSNGAVLLLEPLDVDDIQVGSNASAEQCPPSDVSNSGDHSQVLDV